MVVVGEADVDKVLVDDAVGVASRILRSRFGALR